MDTDIQGHTHGYRHTGSHTWVQTYRVTHRTTYHLLSTLYQLFIDITVKTVYLSHKHTNFAKLNICMNAFPNAVAFSCEVAYLFPVKWLFPMKWPNSQL